jgi:hypothetical protein
VSVNKVNYITAMAERSHIQLKTYCDILVTITCILKKITVSEVHAVSTNETIPEYGK